MSQTLKGEDPSAQPKSAAHNAFIGHLKIVFTPLGLLAFAIFAAPPPRAFLAVASDIIQVMVLLSAVYLPIWLLTNSTDASADGFFSLHGTEVISSALTKMQEHVLGAMLSCLFAIVTLLFSKLVCAWFEPHRWAWPICRVLAGSSGVTLLAVALQSRHAFLVPEGLQFLQNSIRAAREQQDEPSKK